MNKLSRNEGIAVAAGLALLAYLFFSGPLINLFSPAAENNVNNNQMIETGFEAQDVVVGSGELVERGDIITAHYVGKLVNGRVFDSSLDSGTPISFRLGEGRVIRGWDEGLVGMRVGGTRILTIAPDYGYGAQAVGAIPSNSVLIFEVEVVDVEKGQ